MLAAEAGRLGSCWTEHFTQWIILASSNQGRLAIWSLSGAAGPSRERQGETQPVRKAAVLVPTAGTSPAGPLSALSMGLALARVTVANVLHSICT